MGSTMHLSSRTADRHKLPEAPDLWLGPIGRRVALTLANSRTWLCHKARLGLFLRVTASALLSFALAIWLGLRVPLWAVLTAIMVTQISVGHSLKATSDYVLGTVGGAIYGGLIGLMLGQGSQAAPLAGLAVAVGPLALIATARRSLTVAPLTAAIVLLAPALTHGTPIAAAVDRMLEVALGAGIGLAVSFVLFPSSAHGLLIEAAARTLERLADALGKLTTGVKEPLDGDAVRRMQDGLGEVVTQLQHVGAEAQRERAMRVSSAPDPEPLLRTLLRLRHDLVMIGRAAVAPLPEGLQARIGGLSELTATLGDFLHASAAALLAWRLPPDLDGVEAALDSYAIAVSKVRDEGLTRGLPREVTERFFALSFALEQIRRNLRDLHRCIAEWAKSPGASAMRG